MQDQRQKQEHNLHNIYPNITNNLDLDKNKIQRHFIIPQFSNDNEQPRYVNNKQYNRMMIMRFKRVARILQINKNIQINKKEQIITEEEKKKKTYTYESRHKHAEKRQRIQNGRFLKTKNNDNIKKLNMIQDQSVQINQLIDSARDKQDSQSIFKQDQLLQNESNRQIIFKNIGSLSKQISAQKMDFRIDIQIKAEEEKVIDNNQINLNNLNNFNHDSEKNQFSNYKQSNLYNSKDNYDKNIRSTNQNFMFDNQDYLITSDDDGSYHPPINFQESCNSNDQFNLDEQSRQSACEDRNQRKRQHYDIL